MISPNEAGLYRDSGFVFHFGLAKLLAIVLKKARSDAMHYLGDNDVAQVLLMGFTSQH